MANIGTSAASVEKSLKGIDFPASKQDLINHAKKNNAPQEVLSILNDMPERQYQTAADVAKGIGEVR